MNETRDKVLALSVRLKPNDSSTHPHATNYTNVAVAQGIVYVDFAFIEPVLLGGIAKTVKDGQEAPNTIDGQIVTRVAMGIDVLARLHLQIEQVLTRLRDVSTSKPNNNIS